MQLWSLILTVGLTSWQPTEAPAPAEPDGHRARVAYRFLDGGMARVVERGRQRGADVARVPGTLVDPASGRTAPVLVGSSVIVRGARGLPDDDSLARLRVERLRVLMPGLGMVLVKSTLEEDALELAARLAAEVETGSLTEAYPNLAFAHRVAQELAPNDPEYPSQFYLEEIDIEAAWALSWGSPEVTVLVADNGCDVAHPDLVDKMDPGFDPFDEDGDPMYEAGIANEHGTACAGIIAASTNNNRDIAGTCPECRLRCARLLPAQGELSTVASDVLTFQFALDTDVDVVSNSWGFVDAIPVPSPLRDAIIEVQQRGRGGLGAVVAFASGNDARTIEDDELLAVPGVLGVGAVNNFGELTQFSNVGRSVDVVAPTGTITTDISGPGGADPGDVTTRFGGTSSACPVVAGVAALVLSAHPELTADEVNELLERTARQSFFATPDAEGHDDAYGFGLVQPAAALEALAPKEEPESEPSAQPRDDEGARPGSGCGAVPGRGGSPSEVLGACAVLLLVGRRRRPRR